MLNQAALQSGKGAAEVNLGGRLFHSIRNVFRLRRIHRQAGQSVYKESLLRIRDGAHTKEDVALWQSHDLTHPSCTSSVAERRVFEKERVHLFCETQTMEFDLKLTPVQIRFWTSLARHGCDRICPQTTTSGCKTFYDMTKLTKRTGLVRATVAKPTDALQRN